MMAKREVRKVVRQNATNENGLKAMISNSCRRKGGTKPLTFGKNEGADVGLVQ